MVIGAFLYERWGFSAIHVHVEASKELRAERYVSRTEATNQEFDDADRHEIEGSAHRLEELADLKIRNVGSLRDLKSQLSEIEDSFGCR